jgi:hypothetical protein
MEKRRRYSQEFKRGAVEHTLVPASRPAADAVRGVFSSRQEKPIVALIGLFPRQLAALKIGIAERPTRVSPSVGAPVADEIELGDELFESWQLSDLAQ